MRFASPADNPMPVRAAGRAKILASATNFAKIEVTLDGTEDNRNGNDEEGQSDAIERAAYGRSQHRADEAQYAQYRDRDQQRIDVRRDNGQQKANLLPVQLALDPHENEEYG